MIGTVSGGLRLAALRDHGLDRMIWFAPRRGLVYLRNPKVACSSIQKSLWLSEEPESFTGKPHLRSVGPFNAALLRAVRDPTLLAQATSFSVVRNPFSRLLSAYLDKVVVADDRQVWKTIRHRFQIPREVQPSLAELLERMLADPDPTTIDHHLRPQHINVLHGIAPLSHLGYMEDFDGVASFLGSHGCTLETHAKHARSAGLRVGDHFDERTRQLALEFYREDFEVFGYGEELHDLRPRNPRQSLPGSMMQFARELSRAMRQR